MPCLSAVIAGLGGFYFGRIISTRISIGCMLIAALISLFLYFEICLSDSVVIIKLFTWIKIELINLNFGLLFDNITCIMSLIICWISFFVHLYSI